MKSSDERSVEFSEEQFQSHQELITSLLGLNNDPRSVAYHRQNFRPPIPWLRLWLGIIIPIGALAAWGVYSAKFPISKVSVIVGWVLLLGIIVGIALKHAIIAIIQIYQRFAPDRIRNKCRFEPSCSQYTIRALQRYGLIRGLSKGVNRIYRCSFKHDGGFEDI